MPIIDFATALKSELVYECGAYSVNTYAPDSSLNYSFDARGFYEAVLVVNAGTFAGGCTVVLRLQESDDKSSWTYIDGGTFPVIAASPSGAEVSDNAQYYCRINLFDKKRYIGVHAQVQTARATYGISALLLSYDTKDSTTPSVIV